MTLQPMSLYPIFAERVRSNIPVALVTVIDGPHVGATMLVSPSIDAVGTLGEAELDRVVARDALGEVEAGRTGVRHYGPQGQTTPEDLVDTPTVRVFIEAFSPPPTMWIFGAVDFTAALAKVAKVLGYYVVVCDAREVFATRRRFPMADEKHFRHRQQCGSLAPSISLPRLPRLQKCSAITWLCATPAKFLLLAVVFQWPTKFWFRGQHRYLLSAVLR